ncbi:gamma-glutamylcyclotransferase 2-3 isoform X2 [Dioscorea cayenensis subsp. rotundata]|uniref:glutathione-specific gamma-glutamylcyclotransferase n=1 Tax=Dioscorea cayennensis subsp. rotundata TaxID=55577 RepID=A0AB40CZD4_DIOCR|nr:gamma-glutamylcyclotransferase 2-3 isoform X2 [Dioscorea cayenensis subsp. rotundata]
MVLWVFGYGSLIWKAGFRYDERLIGFVQDYRRVFYQGSTDHRGTPDFPGRTVTLERVPGDVCWGVAYRVSGEEDEKIALSDPSSTSPSVSGVLVYIASPDKMINVNYLGPASLGEIAKQIIHAEGPSGPNRDYLFHLEDALIELGCEDSHVIELANTVRKILSDLETG